MILLIEQQKHKMAINWFKRNLGNFYEDCKTPLKEDVWKKILSLLGYETQYHALQTLL